MHFKTIATRFRDAYNAFKTIFLSVALSFALLGGAWFLAQRATDVSIDMGQLADTPENRELVARTFDTSLTQNTDAKKVRVYFQIAPSYDWHVLYYNRESHRMYFGSTRMIYTHGSPNQLVDPTEFGCMMSERYVCEIVANVISGKRNINSFDESFSLFQDIGYCA